MASDSDPTSAGGPGVAGAGTDASWSEIAFARVGADLSPAELEKVVARASALLALPCRLLADELAVEPLLIPGRVQVDADQLLSQIGTLAAGRPGPLVGLTRQDLAIPIFTFVFGRAPLGGRAALVSLARLQPTFYGLPADPEVALARTLAEVLHELGHLAGLGHCPEPACLMRFAANVETVDLRGHAFCASCAAALPRGLLAG